jgi:hypothetical protein
VLAPRLHLIILRTLLLSFISPSYISIVIDSISPKDTSIICALSCEGIDQTTLKLYSLKILLTSSNPSLAKFTN